MKVLMLIICLTLSACASQPKCIRVSYWDYGDVGRLQRILQFSGKYYARTIGNTNGIVIVDKYLGDGNHSMFEQCKEPANLTDGWYTVAIDEGQGTWYLNGEGYGGAVDIRPVVITQKALSKIIKTKGD